MADDPICEQAAAAAAGNAKLFGIDISALKYFIHAKHQVFEVVTRIAILNNVAELLPIGRASAWIGIEHHVALGGHPLKFMVKDETVRRVRPAVNIEDERIFFRWIKVRRLLDPAVSFLAIKTGVPDFFRLGQG